MPSLRDVTPEEFGKVPQLKKLLISGTLHTWRVNEGDVVDFRAFSQARTEFRKLSSEFQSALREMVVALANPQFMAEVAVAPAALVGFEELLDDKSLPQVEIATISPLSAAESETLVREASSSK